MATKILVGVDTREVYRPALNLAMRLGLPDPEYILAHSVEIPVMLGYPGEGAAYVSTMEALQEAGTRALAAAAEQANTAGTPARTVSLLGTPAAALIEYAQENGCELIAVQSERKSSLGRLFLGSVSRGLCIAAPHSVLVSKTEVAKNGPLHAVFATDHSDYANRALELFLKWAPRGIDRIDVLTSLSFPPDLLPVADALHPEYDALTAKLEQLNDAVTQRLRSAGYQAEHQVVKEETNRAIAKTIDETGADFLIMGAHGHGFVHRLLLGSTSLHQIVAEPWPVLLLRP